MENPQVNEPLFLSLVLVVVTSHFVEKIALDCQTCLTSQFISVQTEIHILSVPVSIVVFSSGFQQIAGETRALFPQGELRSESLASWSELVMNFAKRRWHHWFLAYSTTNW